MSDPTTPAPERPACCGDHCTATATHGPGAFPVACWQHAGDWPEIPAPPPSEAPPTTESARPVPPPVKPTAGEHDCETCDDRSCAVKGCPANPDNWPSADVLNRLTDEPVALTAPDPEALAKMAAGWTDEERARFVTAAPWLSAKALPAEAPAPSEPDITTLPLTTAELRDVRWCAEHWGGPEGTSEYEAAFKLREAEVRENRRRDGVYHGDGAPAPGGDQLAGAVAELRAAAYSGAMRVEVDARSLRWLVDEVDAAPVPGGEAGEALALLGSVPHDCCESERGGECDCGTAQRVAKARAAVSRLAAEVERLTEQAARAYCGEPRAEAPCRHLPARECEVCAAYGRWRAERAERARLAAEVERLTAELARETIAAQDMSEQMATARTDRDRYRACWKDALAGLKTVGAERDALRSKLAKAEERAIAQATAIAELLPPQPPGDLVDAVAGELQRLRTKLEAAERSIGAATIDLHAAREQAAQALALARQQGDDATRAEQRVAELEQQLAHLTNPPVVTTT